MRGVKLKFISSWWVILLLPFASFAATDGDLRLVDAGREAKTRKPCFPG